MPRLRICVFCGSSDGRSPEYRDAAHRVGTEIAARGAELVYGGSAAGLMGVAANAALSAGAPVTGVLPHALAQAEIAHQDLTRLDVVADMARRKELMTRDAHAFLVLPGGLGTLDELFEVWTASNLGLASQPIGFLNTNGFFDRLLDFLDHAVACGFVSASAMDLITVGNDPSHVVGSIIDRIADGAPAPDPTARMRALLAEKGA